MNRTGIAWTNETWNVFSGCVKVSPGCNFCFAKTIAERHRGDKAFPDGFELTIREHRLEEPLKIKEPRLIFVNSMSDFFLEEVPDELRDHMVDVMERTSQHQYQILTKRSNEMLRYISRRKLPSNCWLGVSVENQDFVSRIDVLRQVNVEVRFLSLEPLLSPLKLNLDGIRWVIVGGESGSHLTKPEVRAKRSLVDYDPKTKKWTPRPDRYHWVSDIRDQCVGAGVPFFFKQWGGPKPDSGGNLLDGRTWEGYPRLPEQIDIDVDVENTMVQIEPVIETPDNYQLTEAESAELANLETSISRGLQTFWQVGEALFTIRDKRLYRATHATFDAYCREKWQMSKTQANRLIGAADVAKDLTPIGVIPSSESVARPLVSVPKERRQEVWQKAADSAVDSKPTAADVALAAKEIKEPTTVQSVDDANDAEDTGNGAIAADVESTLPEILGDEHSPDAKEQGKPFDRLTPLMSSESPEHYTPKHVLDAVIDCIGEIELDPCSNNKEHPNVPAKRHFTLEDDGLSLDWKAETLFMNPPYGRAIEPWIEKLVSSHSSGNVVSAIALVPARTDTQWFRRLRDYPVCFVEGRLTFLGNEDPAPFPSAIFYLGLAIDKFYYAFRHLGDIWERAECSAEREAEIAWLRAEVQSAMSIIALLQEKVAQGSSPQYQETTSTFAEPSLPTPDEVSAQNSKTLTRQELADLKKVTAEAVRLREKKGIKQPKEIKGTLKEWGYEAVPESSPRRYRKI